MKHFIKTIVVGSLLSFALSLGVGAAFANLTAKPTQALGSYTTDSETYYSSISASATGETLASSLHELMMSTHTTYVTYTSLNTTLSEAMVDPHNANYLIGFWSGYSLPGEWNSSVYNKEHVWAQSHSNSAWTDSYGGADMHHIRPTASMLNISRGNKAYGVTNHATATQLEINGYYTGSYDGASANNSATSVFEPRDDVKGDTARLLLYMYVHYSTKMGSTSFTTTTHCADLTTTIGDVVDYADSGSYSSVTDLLLAWSDADPVDEWEMHANEVAASYQGNRNPFIDYPSLAHSIWDPSPTAYKGLVMDAKQHVKTGNTLTPSGRFYTPSGVTAPTITYATSNADVLSVSGTTIRGEMAGSAVLTGTAVYNGTTYTATTVVTVEPAVTGVIASLDNATVNVGATLDLKNAVVPSNAYNRLVTWSSSNTSIATVDSVSGSVTGVAAGTCTITCTAADGGATDTVALTVSAVSTTSGRLNITRQSFPSGALSYGSNTWTCGPFSGTGYTYSTSTQGDIQFNSTKSGTTNNVMRNSTSIPAITKVVVKGAGVNATSWNLYLSTSTALTYSNKSSTGTSQGAQTMATTAAALTWNPSYSSGFHYFYLDLTSSGAANLDEIDIYYGNATSGVNILYLNTSSSSMKTTYNPGETLDLSGLVVTAVFDDYSTADVTSNCTFTPSAGTVLTLSDTAVVVNFSYTSSTGQVRTASATVAIHVNGSITLTSVTLNVSTLTLSGVGATDDLIATAHFNDGSTAIVTSYATWSTASAATATVSAGTVTAVAAGTTTITVSYTYGGVTQTATCSVTVSATPTLSSITATAAPDCTFGNPSYTPTSSASFVVTAHYTSGGADAVVTSSVTYTNLTDWTSASTNHYNKVLGLHNLVVSYTEGSITRTCNVPVRTTNVGAVQTGGSGTATWNLVTDASTLAVGDVVVIAASDYDFAISTTQNSNNRGQTAITKSADKSTISTPSTSVQQLTVGAGSVTGTYTLSTGDAGYLYAASSSANYLRTRTTLDGNASWTITISSNVASLVANGTYTRKTMQYNLTSTLFACYASASQKSLAIYRQTASSVTYFTDADQSAATTNYIAQWKTCFSGWTSTEIDEIPHLAIEYNAMVPAAKTLFMATSNTIADYNYGIGSSYDYDQSTGEYTGSTTKNVSPTAYQKLYAIIAQYNGTLTGGETAITLYTTSQGTTTTGGDTTPAMLDAAGHIINPNSSQSSLSITLIVVASTGVMTLLLIAGIYVFSRKKRKQI